MPELLFPPERADAPLSPEALPAEPRGPTVEGADAPAGAPGTPDVCLNCRAARLGAYCHACGQHHLEDRLTLRLLWAGVVARFLLLDGVLVRTARDLSVGPGQTALAYVRGRRQRYVNPLSYYLVATAVSLFLYSLNDGDTRMREVITSGAAAYGAVFTAAQSARFIEIVVASVSVSLAYKALVLVMSIAVVWRVVFRRRRFTLAETLVPALFGFAQVTFVSLPLSLAETVGLTAIPPAVLMLVSVGLTLVLLGWTAVGFFGGRPWRTFALGAASYVAAFVLYSVIRDGTLVAYVLFTTP